LHLFAALVDNKKKNKNTKRNTVSRAEGKNRKTKILDSIKGEQQKGREKGSATQV